MPTQTMKLGLPKPLGNENFTRAKYNELIDAIDSKAGVADGLATLGANGKVPASQLDVSAPQDASTTQKGVVQLSSATNSTSEALAATPKAVKAVDDKIGILSGLNTTAKTNLVSAINEVFQTGNNVKSDMVAALLAVDPTLPITANSSWAEIETAAGQIETGGKFAIGVATSSGTPSTFQNLSGSNVSAGKLSVNGLSFKPSAVFAYQSNGVLNSAGSDDSGIPKVSGYNSLYLAGSSYNIRIGVSNCFFRSDGFDIPTSVAGLTVTWVAYEKGAV